MTLPSTIVCCLAGNPNTGKTTIFNNLTGARQKVGNYAGVTVERIEGTRKNGSTMIRFIDLPGAYSLNARSADEKVSRDVLLLEQPDIVIQVIDASQLGRNLQLTMQLLEMGLPLVIALNMTDEALKNGIQVFPKKLAEALGVPVVPTIGSKRWGMNELVQTVIRESARIKSGQGSRPKPILFDVQAERMIAPLVEAIEAACAGGCLWNAPWAAKLLLENDVYLLDDLCSGCDDDRREILSTIIRDVRNTISLTTGVQSDVFIGAERSQVIERILAQSMRREIKPIPNKSERIDRILVNRFLGLPIFFAVMYLVFWLSVDVSSPLIDLVDSGFAALGSAVSDLLAPGMFQSLIVDGIIAAVGGVLVFVPQIMIMFFCISLLEASGYLARAAFIIDRAMHAIGLHGRSFIPMLVGFGCNVPALLATRSIENRRDRLTTMMTIPFMSCGARLPVYLLITGAFFPGGAGANVIFGLYLLGVLVAIATAKIFRTFVWNGEPSPFVFEIPPYRRPAWRGVFAQMWLKASSYIKKAGTVIIAAAIVIWFLTNYPQPEQESTAAWESRISALADSETNRRAELKYQQKASEMKQSYAGRLGSLISPILAPVGLDDWKVSVALIAGFSAKEIVVGTMGALYAIGDHEDENSVALQERIRQDPFFVKPAQAKAETLVKAKSEPDWLRGLALMVFVLLYLPCQAVIGVFVKEAGVKLALVMVGWTSLVAWVVTLLVYQGGRVLGF
jgi:ferrous iron transport protein B